VYIMDCMFGVVPQTKPFTRIESSEGWKPGKVGNRTILTGDIGGTNSRFALIGVADSTFMLLHREIYPSGKLSGVAEGVQRFLESVSRKKNLHPDSASISAAGPVKNNTCTLSNLNWIIDGDSVGNKFGFPTLIINDFLAMSYGIPFLNPENSNHIAAIPHTNGKRPKPSGPVSAIIGAGTGLGVGMLADIGERYLAFPSEGGHADFSTWNKDTERLKDSVQNLEGYQVESEHFISGDGISRIFDFVKGGEPSNKQPSEIASSGKKDPAAKKTMELFVQSYGRFAGNAALFFLPFGGLFLGGGIVSKNIPYFLENNNFIKSFENTERPRMRDLLTNIPVYIIKDYSVSLFGAAYALLVTGSPLQGGTYDG
jgi:glucokinase